MTDQLPQHRFYIGEPLRRGSTVALSRNASEQIRKVLRLRIGDDITVFDGEGSEAIARIASLKRSQTTVEITSDALAGRRSSTPKIHLGVALLKSDRFEMVIQKATELGAARITPLETDRSVVSLPADRLRSRMERWRRIAIEALEQSGRSDWVEINEPRTLSDACTSLDAERKLIAWEDETPGEVVASAVDGSEASIAVLIGPEGGFSGREVEAARDAGYQSVSLGGLVLRSETAAITVMAMIRAVADAWRPDSTHARED